tara:strand:+ start:1659 stop:2144 length:486 start_codon:yes stop_codon:yes gene_type:complete
MPIIGLIFFIIAFDQWSKWAIRSSFDLFESKIIIENFLHFYYITNDGMAFGLQFPGGRHVLLVMTIILTGFILGLLWKEKNSHPLMKYGLALIFSGAVGNLIDRVISDKGVTDFIHVMIGDHFSWYIFNIADSSVTIGMIMFIFYSIFIEKNLKMDKINDD